MGVRIYLPTTGRFLQTDPVAGGSANAYDYANQDPIDQFDLTGQYSAWCHLFTWDPHCSVEWGHPGTHALAWNAAKVTVLIALLPDGWGKVLAPFTGYISVVAGEADSEHRCIRFTVSGLPRLSLNVPVYYNIYRYDYTHHQCL
jgi:hypothetical protein